MDITFATDSNKIRTPITEVILRAAAGNLARSKNQQEWTPRNAVLLLPFLTEATVLNGELDAGELLNIFACSITEWEKEGETSSGDDDDKDSEGGVKAEDKKMMKNARQSRTPPRRWTPPQMIATMSWSSSRPLHSSHHESLRRHYLFACTISRVSGSVRGFTEI